MSKKLFFGMVPLFATFALAIVPAAAPAAEHRWFSNGAALTPGQGLQPTISWGELSLKGAAEINCQNVIAGDGGNLGAGTKGTGHIYRFAAFNCESPTIAAKCGGLPVAVEAQKLPWLTELVEEGGKTRLKVTGVKVVIGCEIPPEDHVTGTAFVIGPKQKQTPLAPLFPGPLGGTEALTPGKVKYDAGSGSLEAEGSGETVNGITEGETKIMGYNEQELVQARL